MKRFLKLCVVLLMIFLVWLVFYKRSSSAVTLNLKGYEEKNMNSAISEYVLNDYFNWSNVESKTKFEAHKIYGLEEKGKEIYAYGYVMFFAYDFSKEIDKNKEMEEEAGGCKPIVFIMEKKGEEYDLKGHLEPEDGVEYLPSVKKIFPPKYVDIILDEVVIQKELKDNILEQVKKYKK